jgi:glycosyltransferase involved in cell wall biosynthesis
MIRALVALGVDRARVIDGVFPMEYEATPESYPADDHPYLVYYGSSLPVKGIPTLLDALHYVAQPIDLRLYVLHPSTTLRSRVNEIRRTSSHTVELDDSSRWMTGVREAVARARAVVIPSAWHGPHELVAYESMSLGRAVVVSSGSANADLVSHEEDGLIFLMNDAQQLAHAIDRVWQDPDLAARLGSNARQTYERLLHPDRWYGAFMRAVVLARSAQTADAAVAGPADM